MWYLSTAGALGLLLADAEVLSTSIAMQVSAHRMTGLLTGTIVALLVIIISSPCVLEISPPRERQPISFLRERWIRSLNAMLTGHLLRACRMV